MNNSKHKFIYYYFFKFYFIFKLYIIVLVFPSKIPKGCNSSINFKISANFPRIISDMLTTCVYFAYNTLFL